MQKTTHHVSVPCAQPKQAGCQAERPTAEGARAGGGGGQGAPRPYVLARRGSCTGVDFRKSELAAPFGMSCHS